MIAWLRRPLAAAVCLSLLLSCPGLEPYAALGAAFSSSKAAPRAVLPGVSLPQLPVSPALLEIPRAAALSAVAAPAAGPLEARQAEVLEVVERLAEPHRSQEQVYQLGRRLEGDRREGSDVVVSPRALPASSRRGNRARSFVAAAALMLGLSGSLSAFPLPAHGPPSRAASRSAATQPAAPPAPAQEAPAPAAAEQKTPPVLIQAPVVLSEDVAAEVAFDRQGMTVGERFHVTLTVRNTTDAPLTIVGLRESLEYALPAEIELQGSNGDEEIVLAAGEARTISVEAIAFGAGELMANGPLEVTLLTASGETLDIAVALPAATLGVKTVLTPDWKQKGFRDIAPVMKRQVPQWVWAAALPLLVLLLVGVERLLAAQKQYPKVPLSRLPLVVVARQRAAALKARLEAPRSEFYAEFDAAVTGFLIDFHGLSTVARTPERLIADLKALKKLSPGQLRVASDLVERADTARFSGLPAEADERLRDLTTFEDVIDSLAGKAPGAQEPEVGASHLPGVAALQFGSPLALLLFVPFFGYLAWKWMHRSPPPAFTVSTSATLPARKSPRQRFSFLPSALRRLALAAILTAIAQPQLGVHRDVVYRPSTDTIVSIDLSGSMSGDKLEAAKAAVAAYVVEQRRGTENRVGMMTFSDNPYVDVRLTTDYDALIAHLKELRTTGSTAIGKTMLTGIAHFIELNVLELNDPKDPRIQEVQHLIKTQGVAAALEYAKGHEDLMDKILQPKRAKVLVVFTDGESNDGISPEEAAVIAKRLGVKVYTVFIGSPYGAGEATLKTVAATTGALHYRADDAAGMRAALLDIDRLEKSPSRVVSSLSIKSYSRLFIFLALAALGLEVALSNTRLRALQAAVLLSLPMTGGLQGLPPGLMNPAAVVAQAEELPLSGVPEEVAAANLLYNTGRFDEALKKYDEALAHYPDLPELYFNMGNAYLRLGELDKAQASYEKFLSISRDPALASRALYNLGNLGLAKQDSEQALEMYKEALRRDSSNEDAKWNLEVLKKLQEEQPQDQKSGKKKQKGKKGQKGDPSGPSGGLSDDSPGGSSPEAAQSQPSDGKSGAERLGEALEEQQKAEAEAERKRLTRKGSEHWGMLALPLAMAGGTALTFSAPLWAWAAAVVVPLAVLLMAYGVHKRLAAAKALTPRTAPAGYKSWWGRPRFARKVMLVAAAAGLLTLSAGKPQSGYKDERVNFGGKDIVVAVDGSHSMIYAEDGRLEKTKEELAQFVARMEGTDRIGLVVFAAQARTASPLSIDYGNFEFKIGRLELEARGLIEGSKLVEGIEQAVQAFETVKKVGDRQRVLILISDGDIFNEDLAHAASLANRHGIAVFTIGMGTEKGSGMKVPTEDGEGTEYIQDDKGGMARTKLNEAPLRQLALRTGGEYFRADGSSIQAIMGRVAELNQGEKGDTIRSPRDAAEVFLWPALLLLVLDLMIPGRSMLRRDDDKDKLAGGALLLGAALLPLQAWLVILPLAALTALLGGALAADLWTDGALMRRLVWTAQRRRGVVQNGLSQDLPRLFSVREVDEARLREFLKAWLAASDGARAPLIEQAAADAELWRQKLALAYMAGAPVPTQEALLDAMGRASRMHLRPMGPVIRGLLAQRGKLSWLEHIDAQRALSRLKQAWIDSPQEASRPKSRRPSRLKSGLKRLTLAVVVFIAAGGLTLTGAAGHKTIQYVQESRKAAEASSKIFFGEDAFIFADHYADDRIARYVLPALRRWSSGTKSGAAELERAMQVLLESADPKADNVLEAMLRHSDLLPLTEEAEATLLRAFIVRDSDQAWAFIIELLQSTADKPQMVERMKRMIGLLIELDEPRAFENVFHFLKSPNPHLRDVAARAIYGSLTEPERLDEFYYRLIGAQSRYAAEPVLNLWIETFMLQRETASPSAGELRDARRLLDQIFDSLMAFDAARAAALAAPVPQGQKPPELASATASGIRLLEKMIGESGQAQAVTELAKYEVDRMTTQLIKDAESQFPRLHDELIKRGIVLPDSIEIHRFADDDDYGFFGFGGGYFGHRHFGPSAPPARQYRQTYTLEHLRALRAAIAEAGQAADPARLTPPAREIVDRAEQALAQMEATGKAAGMIESSTVAQKAADDVRALLVEGRLKFPANFAGQGQDAYTLQEMQALRARLEGLSAATFQQEKFKVGALWRIDDLMVKHYGRPPPSAAQEDADFWRRMEAPGGPSLGMARLSMGAERFAGSEARLGEVLQAALALAPLAPKAELKEVLDKVFMAPKAPSAQAALYAQLAAALKGADPKSILANIAREQVRAEAAFLIAGGIAAFPELNQKLVAANVPSLPGSSAKLKQLHLHELRRLSEEAAREAQARGALDERQTAASAVMRQVLPALIKAAPAAGIPAGNTPEELVAESVNALLNKGYMVFYGDMFDRELRKRGLAPPHSGHDIQEGYFQRYAKEDLLKIRAMIAEIEAGGQGWSGIDTRRPLNDKENLYLFQALTDLDAIIAAYPTQAQKLYGFAPLMLMMATPSWGLALVGLAALAYLIYRLAQSRRKSAAAAAAAAVSSRRPRSISADAARRAKRVELAVDKIASSVAGGSFRSLFVGSGGSDFTESRQYQGEDRRDIDWKATAKTGDVQVKKYELEKEMALLLVIDVSGSSDYGTRGADKRAVIEDAAAVLSLAAARLSLRVGAVLVSDRIEAYLPPKGGQAQAQEILRRLRMARPQGRGTDLKPALELALKEARSRALVVVVSDFIAPDFRQPLAAAAGRHDVRIIRVEDPSETRPLPDVGLLAVRDSETGQSRQIDTSDRAFQAEQAALIAGRQARLAEAFTEARLRPLVLSTEGDYLQALQDHFDAKRTAIRSTP